MIQRTLLVALFATALVISTSAAAETIRLGGTGGATALLRYVIAANEKAGNNYEVIPNLGSSGALRALLDGHLDIAVSGRALKGDEKAKGLTSVLEVRTPHVLATSNMRPDALKRTEVASLYRNKEAAWKDGTLIRIGLRPKSDSETDALIISFPEMAAALAELRNRPDLSILATDQDNADWAEKTENSLVSSTLTQILMEKRNLRLIELDGVSPSIENLEDGKYPIQKSLYFVTGPNSKEGVKRLIEFLRTERGYQTLRQAHVIPAR